jgi:hypothetical protein
MCENYGRINVGSSTKTEQSRYFSSIDVARHALGPVVAGAAPRSSLALGGSLSAFAPGPVITPGCQARVGSGMCRPVDLAGSRAWTAYLQPTADKADRMPNGDRSNEKAITYGSDRSERRVDKKPTEWCCKHTLLRRKVDDGCTVGWCRVVRSLHKRERENGHRQPDRE